MKWIKQLMARFRPWRRRRPASGPDLSLFYQRPRCVFLLTEVAAIGQREEDKYVAVLRSGKVIYLGELGEGELEYLTSRWMKANG